MWFGDERGYNATERLGRYKRSGCGLVMKEDITQLRVTEGEDARCCGLVMKEDITQLASEVEAVTIGCGLVMKEDITQLLPLCPRLVRVVVW